MKQALLFIIREKGNATVKELSALTGKSWQTISEKLRQLSDDGLIKAIRGANNCCVWYPVEAAAKLESVSAPPIQRTLHRRQIVSLFNPVEFA